MSEQAYSAVPGGKGPHGIGIDPMSGEVANYAYVGISEGDLVFRRSSGGGYVAALQAKWEGKDQYENEIEGVREFSRISDFNGVESYAAAHGPLFGPVASSHEVCREPLEAWYFEIGLMSLAYELVAAEKSGKWRGLQDGKVAFEFEKVLGGRDLKKIAAGKAVGYDPAKSCWSVRAFCKFGCEIPEICQRLILADEYNSGIWVSRRVEGAAEEWKEFLARPLLEWAVFDETRQDCRESEEEMLPGISAGVVVNETVDDTLGKPGRQSPASIRQPLESRPELAEKYGPRLCRLLYETLVSAHIRNVPHDWISHEFRPVFTDRLRFMWYIVSTYADKASLDFCAHCGKPYIRLANKPQKYCSKRCHDRAAKARSRSAKR